MTIRHVPVTNSSARAVHTDTAHAAPKAPTLPDTAIGAGIGILSGLTGMGGGASESPSSTLGCAWNRTAPAGDQPMLRTSRTRPQWKARTARRMPSAATTSTAAAAIEASRSPPWNSE